MGVLGDEARRAETLSTLPATRALRWVIHGALSPAERETNPFGTWVFCARVFLPADPPGLWRAGGRLGGLLHGRGAVCATGL
jgi:hypothetical protein